MNERNKKNLLKKFPKIARIILTFFISNFAFVLEFFFETCYRPEQRDIRF